MQGHGVIKCVCASGVGLQVDTTAEISSCYCCLSRAAVINKSVKNVDAEIARRLSERISGEGYEQSTRCRGYRQLCRRCLDND